jgi:hypothetical protein
MADFITLHHATSRRNLRSIYCTGLQPSLARGKRKAVWLHAAAKRAWAVQHVARRAQRPCGRGARQHHGERSDAQRPQGPADNAEEAPASVVTAGR